MSTSTQAAASRANGAQSTGPVTPEGKARSAQNALQHGFRSAAVLIPGEDPAEFERHRAAYLERFRPADPPERDLVEAIAAARWRLRRLLELEARLLQESGEPGDLARALSIVTRYEGQLNRAHDRALQQLESLQANRPQELQSAPSGAFAKRQPNEPSRADFQALLESLTAPPRFARAMASARVHASGAINTPLDTP